MLSQLQGLHAESFSRFLLPSCISLIVFLRPDFAVVYLISAWRLCSATLPLLDMRGNLRESCAWAHSCLTGFLACGSEASCCCHAGDLRRSPWWRATKLCVFPFPLSNCTSQATNGDFQPSRTSRSHCSEKQLLSLLCVSKYVTPQTDRLADWDPSLLPSLLPPPPLPPPSPPVMRPPPPQCASSQLRDV